MPQYTWLDLKRYILGIGILNFPEYRDWFKENFIAREGGTCPDITLYIKNSFVIVKSFFEGKNKQEITV